MFIKTPPSSQCQWTSIEPCSLYSICDNIFCSINHLFCCSFNSLFLPTSNTSFISFNSPTSVHQPVHTGTHQVVTTQELDSISSAPSGDVQQQQQTLQNTSGASISTLSTDTSVTYANNSGSETTQVEIHQSEQKDKKK